MHVLMIAQYFPPDLSGVSTRAYNAAKGLISQGCKVTIVTAFPHYPLGDIPKKYKGKLLCIEKEDEIKIIRTWVPRLPHSSNTKRIILHIAFILSSLLGLLFVRKVNVIFSMNPNFFAFIPALVYKIFFRKKIIRNVDDMWPEVFYDLGYVKSRFLRKILDYFALVSYRIPVALTPLSPSYIEIITSKYHIPNEKIILIEHGVDTTLFRSVNTKSSSNIKTVMYSGALGYGYDFETVILSAKLLESEAVRFVIRGLGELEDYLRKMIKDADLKNLELDTEKLSKEELISFLNKADIFLLPMSKVRGFDYGLPTKLLEYQALRKPVVCISDGECKRYLLETKSGLVTSSRDPKELARLIMELVNDEKLSNELGKNGFEHVHNNFTIEAVGKRFMQVLNKFV